MRHAITACLLIPILAAWALADEHGAEKVSINFSGMELEQVIQWASEATGKRFLYDEKIMKRKVYLTSSVDVPKNKAMEVLLEVLKANRMILVRAGSPDAEIYEVAETIEATKQAIETFGDGERDRLPDDARTVTIVVRLRYADARSVQTTLQPLISDPKGIVVVDEVGAVVLTDYASNVKRILKILAELDHEPTGHRFSIVRLRHASAAKVAALLSPMIGPATKEDVMRRQKPPQVAADDRTNQLVLYAEEFQRQDLMAVIASLDVEDTSDGEPREEGAKESEHKGRGPERGR